MSPEPDQKAHDQTRKPDAEDKPHLEDRYGSIGIPAVAAAARYQRKTKDPAATPAESEARVPEEA